MKGIRSLGFVAALLWAAPLLGQAAEEAASSAVRALDAVRADRIVADVYYVAADDMGGRDTPSTGLRLTARFIRNRLVRLGWRPGAREGWFQTYPLTYRRVKEPETRLTLQKGERQLTLDFGRDYFFSAQDLEPLETGANLLYCGMASAEEIASVTSALKGKWALCLDVGKRGENLVALLQPIKAAGAVGVVFVQPKERSGRSYADDFSPALGLMRVGWTTWPTGEPDPRRGTVFPQLYLPRETAERLNVLAGYEPSTLGQEIPVRLTDTRRLVNDGRITCENVVGWWPGSDPVLSKEAILVSAHYDHVGTAPDGQVFNGADDNASGTCGLLALAEALVVGGPLRRSVALIWVSGEEKGLFGSQAWAAAPWLPNEARPIADINIDMIGRNAPSGLLVTPSRNHTSYNGLTRLVERVAPSEGFTNLGSADAYWTRSDHANFAKLGIPVTFLFDDVHEDYHKPTDDAEKIDGDKCRRVVRVVLRMLQEMQDDQLEFLR